MIGDGFCNDEANNLDCNFDGGDCCGKCINMNLCKNCSCFTDVIGNDFPNALVGDGYCNDETNNMDCNYDGGDCCLSVVSTDNCTECLCHVKGMYSCTVLCI